MKAMYVRRLAAAALAVMLFLTLAAPVLAASTTMVATANVYVRSGPGKQYKVLATLYKGKAITKTGTSGQWSKVVYNKKTAYVMTIYLKAYSSSTPAPSISVEPTPTPTPTPVSVTMYTLVSTTIRSGPGLTYGAIGYLDAGQSVTPTGAATAGYYPVQLGGRTGYVAISDLSTQNTVSGNVYAVSTTPVYSGSSTTTAILGYLNVGQYATRTGAVGSMWTIITYNGQAGYVLTAQLTGSPTGVTGMVYASASQVPVYSSTAASSTLGYLTQGQGATSLGATGIWTQIVYNGQTGYVLSSQVTNATGSGATGFTTLGRTMYALSSGVACYTQPYAMSTYYVGYLSLNESVWALATNGTWIQVYVQGQSQALYVPANSLGYTAGGTGTAAGATLYVQLFSGAATYSDTNGTAFTYTYKPAGSTVMETVASIDRGVAVKVISSYGDWVYVSWAGRDGLTRNAYVMMNKLGATSPA